MTEEYLPEDFISLLYYADCVVGNSSSICKELSVLGTPGCLVGSRQDGRLIGKNTIRVPYNRDEIIKIIRYQIGHGRYEIDTLYYVENSEEKICNIIKSVI